MKHRIRILLATFMAAYTIMSVVALQSLAAAMEEPAREAPEAAVGLTTTPQPHSSSLDVTERLKANRREREREYQEMIEERDREREAEGLVVLDDGSVLYLTLDDIRENITLYYSEQEIAEVARMVRGENGDYMSKTIWSAHVWSVLNRVGKKGFTSNGSILGIIRSGAYDAVTRHPENMARPVREDIREIVVDVFARKVYEDMGAPAELVGRTLPEEFCFFRNEGFKDVRNHFYDNWQGGNEYDPFTAPFNPYDN